MEESSSTSSHASVSPNDDNTERMQETTTTIAAATRTDGGDISETTTPQDVHARFHEIWQPSTSDPSSLNSDNKNQPLGLEDDVSVSFRSLDRTALGSFNEEEVYEVEKIDNVSISAGEEETTEKNEGVKIPDSGNIPPPPPRPPHALEIENIQTSVPYSKEELNSISSNVENDTTATPVPITILEKPGSEETKDLQQQQSSTVDSVSQKPPPPIQPPPPPPQRVETSKQQRPMMGIPTKILPARERLQELQNWQQQRAQQPLLEPPFVNTAPPHPSIQGRTRIDPNQSRHLPPPRQLPSAQQYPSSQAGKQQQQQQYPPPPRRLPPPPQRRPTQTMFQSPSTPVWKSIWKKIEQGLDGLADMEDAVSDRAQKIYSSALETIKEGNVVPAIKISQPWKKSKPRDTYQPPPQLDLSRFRKGISKQPVSGVPARNAPAAQTNADVEKRTGKSQLPDATQSLSRKIDWNGVRYGQVPTTGRKTSRLLIRANGGASSPRDSETQQPPSLENNLNGTSTTDYSTTPLLPTEPDTTNGIQPPPPPPFTAQAPHPATTSYRSGRAATAAAADRTAQRPFAALYRVPASSSEPLSSQQKQRQAQRLRSYSMDDEDDNQSIFAKVGNLMSSAAHFRPSQLNPFSRESSRDYTDAVLDAWKDDEDESNSRFSGVLGRFRKKGSSTANYVAKNTFLKDQEKVITEPMSDLMERCSEGEAASLLNRRERTMCKTIGHQEALLDILILVFATVGLKELKSVSNIQIPRSVVEILTTFITDVLSALAASVDTWAPHAFIGAFLAAKTIDVFCESKAKWLADEVDSYISDEVRYGTLFLKIISSMMVDRDIIERIQTATRAQITSKVSLARLRSFIIFAMVAISLSAASNIGSLFLEGFDTLQKLFSLELWRAWPPQADLMIQGYHSVIVPFWGNALAIIQSEVRGIVEDPLRSVSLLCVFVALLSTALLPSLESRRKISSNLDDRDIDEEEEEVQMHMRFTEQISSLGSSSANRLNLLSVDGRIDSILERWRSLIPRDLSTQGDIAIHSLFRLTVYGILSGIILAAPILLYISIGMSPKRKNFHLFPQWDSVIDLSFFLLFTQKLALDTLSKTVRADDLKEKISGFVNTLVSSVEDRKRVLLAPPSNLQVQASISPTAGLQVRDLWASHASRRAWAVRGANLHCKNGEVLALLGDDAAGKTRLMTCIAECIVLPPRRVLSAVKVRGSISVGGLDVTKWESNQLRKRVGILLNDVRSVGDTAQILTGLSMEEILDPRDGLRNLEPSHNLDANERSSIMLALKIAGLYSTLLRRLPSKLSTIVSANDDDLRPSPLRPRYQILSPSEWSKVLLARTLAQAIYDNENSSKVADASSNCLIGSVLLLDDLTNHLSEIEEARLLQDLRATGAATVLSSNRWATGRLVDKIAVMKDGAIVEVGTHAELMGRGPQQSIYAAKWYAMTQ
jgi:ABC-type multidrug transport system fused ATPase/permease subunit